MNLNEMQNSIRELGTAIRNQAATMAAAAADKNVSVDNLDGMRKELEGMNARMAALQTAYNAQKSGEGAEILDAKKSAPAPEKRELKELLASKEYARAFKDAIRSGMRPGSTRSDRHKVLYDALTIAGGTVAGEDGGFLVPEDIGTEINEVRRELQPLADVFNTEITNANSGWRVIDTEPTTGMTDLNGEVPAGGIDDSLQPKFVKVPFTMTTYGQVVPISAELAADETGNLFGYLARWFAKLQVITENNLLLAELAALTPDVIAANGDPVAAIRTALNVTLDPANSRNAVIITNQDGFGLLDALTDDMGRPLLQPNPAEATQLQLFGRKVVLLSNALLPTANGVAPLYVGDMKQFATLFRRQNLEIASTDIGGNAFRTNAIEVRGVTRLCAATTDVHAAAAIGLTV